MVLVLVMTRENDKRLCSPISLDIRILFKNLDKIIERAHSTINSVSLGIPEEEQ